MVVSQQKPTKMLFVAKEPVLTLEIFSDKVATVTDIPRNKPAT